MEISGIKRGLAVSAVSALAMTGVAIAPSQADTVAEAEAALQLYSQVTGGVSTKYDGQNTTVTLLAGAPTDIAGVPVNSFRFTADIAPAGPSASDVVIGQVANLNGLGTLEWTPPLVNVEGVVVEALDNANVVLATESAGVVNEATAPSNQAVSLDGAVRSPIGIFGGNVVVTGRTTDLANTQVQVSGPAVAAGAPINVVANGVPAPDGTQAFTAVVPVGANDTADAADEIVVTATTGDSDDVNVYTSYAQTGLTATSAVVPPSSADVSAPGNQVTNYVISVKDDQGRPVAGVPVQESEPNGGAYNAGAGTSNSGTTNGLGQFTTSLNEATMDIPLVDQNPAAGVQGTFYLVNLNGVAGFQNGADAIVELTQTSLPQAPASIVVTSSKGNALDDDETTNLTFTVRDGSGAVVPNAAVSFTVARDVADNDPVDSTTPALVAGVTNAQGQVSANGVQLGIDGEKVAVTVRATSGAAVGTLAVETDQADVVWDAAPSAQALAGSSTTRSGSLELPSGTVLPGRAVQVDLLQTTDANGPAVAGATPGNAILSPQSEQPAGTIRGGDLIATATTSATGTFAVKVTDPATPAGQELDDVLRGTGVGLGGDSASDLDVDFLRSLTPVRVNVFRGVGNSDVDGLPNVLGGALRPGTLGIANVKAFNADNVALTDVDVTVTVDQGFFVDEDDAFEGTPVPGAPIDFKSAGKSITVNTGDNQLLVNIERNAGFDDDGLVADKIRASAAGSTDTHDLTWTTVGAPINPRATEPLAVSLSAEQDSTVLPKARAGTGLSAQEVGYDVFAYDQFGNPTQQDIDLLDTSPIAVTGFGVAGDNSTFGLNQPAVVASSPGATTQAIEVELDDAVRTTYADDVLTNEFDPTAPGTSINAPVPVDIEKTTSPITWYETDVDDSTFELSQTGSSAVPVGTTISYTLTATDQEGQALDGFGVGFLRSGPSDTDDDGQFDVRTNAAGQAFYDFVGGATGIANVSAVVYDDDVVDPDRLLVTDTSTVEFTAPPEEEKKNISPNLFGRNGGKVDVLTLRAPRAATATVRLFRIVNGRRIVFRTGVLDVNGVKAFRVKDLNGSRRTRYVAVVTQTNTTNAGRSKVVVVR